MAHYTLIARINAGNGRFPFVNVQFTKTHRPVPIAGATYYLRRSGGARTRKANRAGDQVKKPRKPCHAFRVLYATRRHQKGVDIETLRQELGHSDISTTQIYLRSADRKSDRHRERINQADRFSLRPASGLVAQARGKLVLFSDFTLRQEQFHSRRPKAKLVTNSDEVQ